MRDVGFRMLVLAMVALAGAGQLEGQGIIKKMKTRAQQQAAGRANRAADEAVDSAANKAERTVRCLISDAQCIKAAEESGQAVIVTGADGQPVSSEDSAAAVAAADSLRQLQPPSEWDPSGAPATPEPTATKAGPEPVIAAVDFSQDALGATPQGITLANGRFAVEEHEVEGGRWLAGRERGGGQFFLELPAKLPPVFTLTFDFIGGGGMITVHPSGLLTGAHAMVETSGVGLIHDGKASTEGVAIPEREDGVVHHARVVGNEQALALYIDDTKVAEAAGPALGRRGKRITFGMSVYGAPVMIGSIRVIEGAQ